MGVELLEDWHHAKTNQIKAASFNSFVTEEIIFHLFQVGFKDVYKILKGYSKMSRWAPASLKKVIKKWNTAEELKKF